MKYYRYTMDTSYRNNLIPTTVTEIIRQNDDGICEVYRNGKWYIKFPVLQQGSFEEMSESEVMLELL